MRLQFLVLLAVAVIGISAGVDSRNVTAEGVRIINGQEVTGRERAAFIASLFFKKTGAKMSFVCGAAVVHEKVVLTAAHCLERKQMELVRKGEAKFYVCAGSVDLRTSRGFCRTASKFRIPPKFRSLEETFPSVTPFDVALVAVDRTLVTRRNRVRVARVNLKDAKYGKMGLSYGYGRDTTTGNYTDFQLRYVDSIVKNALVVLPGELFDSLGILPSYEKYFSRSFIAMMGNHDGSRGAICFGDSGGPLVQRAKHGGYRIVGVNSWRFLLSPGWGGTCSDVNPSFATKLHLPRHANFLRTAMHSLGYRFRY